MHRKTALILALSFSLHARAEQLPVVVEDEIVVTASRIPEKISAAIADVTVITAQQIAEAGQTTLVELLQAQPGIELKQSGGPGSQSAIFIRGGNSNQTLVLVDGIRIASATTGSAALESIALDQVERIEILRGPASSIYGADAVAGVIQIFSRQGKGIPHASFSLGAGTGNQFNAATHYGGSSGDTRFDLGAAFRASRGFSATNPAAGSFTFAPDNDGYRNINASFTLEQRLSGDHQIGVKSLYNRNRVQFDSGDPDFNDRSYQTLGSLVLYSHNRLSDFWDSRLTLGLGIDDLASDASYGYDKFKTVNQQAQWQNDFDLPAGVLTGVLEYNRQQVNSSATSYAQDNRSVRAAQLSYQLNEGPHSFFVSGRHDDYSDFGGKATASLGYGYTVGGGLRLTGSLGNSFKAPTFNDLYAPAFWGSNPALRPERGYNREAAVHYDAGPHKLSLTAYRNRIKDLIQANSAWMLENIASAKLQGLELAGETRWKALRLKASFDLQQPEDAVSGKTLVYRARRHGSLEADYRTGKMAWAAQVVGSDARYADAANTQSLPGYAVVNVWCGYEMSAEWKLLGRVNNLLDKDYSLNLGYNTPGINAFVGVEYNPK